MQVPILKTLRKIPGGVMIIPLLIGAAMNSFCPQVLEIGGFSTAMFKTGINAFVALFFVCSGSQIKIKEAALPLAKGTVLLISKFAVGAILGLLISKIWGMAGVLSITPLAVVSAATNSSGTLYVALAQEYGDNSDVAAIGPLCLNDSPFLTMLFFGAAGLADIPLLSLLAAILPLLLGMLIGNLDSDFRKFLEPGTAIITPFVAFALGANLRLQAILSAGVGGIILGLMTVLFTGIGGYYAIAVCNHGKPKAVGAAIGSCAGICSATPMYIAQIDPSLVPYVEASTASCTAATIITAILCPVLVAFLSRVDKKREQKRLNQTVEA